MTSCSKTPRYIGYYRNHRVEFFHDAGTERPWRFVFVDGLPAKSSQIARQWNDPPEADLDSAKAIALSLARERYGGFSSEKWDEWLDLSDVP